MRLRKSGVMETAAMRMTGHKSPVMFKRCAVVRDVDLAAAADRLDARTVIPIAEARRGSGSSLDQAGGSA